MDRSGNLETEGAAEKMKLEFIFKLYQAERWAAPTWPAFIQKLKQHPDGDMLLDNEGDRPETVGQLLEIVSSNRLVVAELSMETEEKLRSDIGNTVTTLKPKV